MDEIFIAIASTLMALSIYIFYRGCHKRVQIL